MTFLDSIKQKFKQLDWALIFILAISAFLRLYLLDLRPVHHDEGINGWFTDQLMINGFYRYDPANYHGPLHFYILFVCETLFGHNVWILRIPTVLFSILSVYWIILFSPFIGKRAALIAAFAMAISPGMIYYGRFAIHEADLMFFTILILWGIVGLYCEGKRKYLWSLGAGISGVILTKETYIIHLICFILAGLCLYFFEKLSPSQSIKIARQTWSKNDLLLIIGINVGIIIFFYSGTFLHFKGVLGIFETFKIWFSTGSGKSGHAKPFFYWANFFMRYEQIALLGFLFSLRYLYTSSKVIRYVAIYGLGVFLAYSVISYKTPWCLINLLWPFYIVFGAFISEFLKSGWRAVLILTSIIGFCASLIIMLALNWIDYCNHKLPYVYVQTLKEINRFSDPIFELVKRDPSKYAITGNVMRTDEWPLPWVLRDFSKIGYYQVSGVPSVYDADFLCVEANRIQEVEENLKNIYFQDKFQLRDAQDISTIYFNYETFMDIFPDREPEFLPLAKEPLIPGQGLFAQFYNNVQLTGEPVIRKAVKKIDFYWENENKPLPAPLSIQFVGEINLPDIGTTLILETDDGGYVDIDNVRVINDPGPHAVQPSSAFISGKSGWHKIKIGYYDNGGGAIIRLLWKDAKGVQILVPLNALRYDERLLNK